MSFKRVNVWAYIFMASRGAAGTVRALRGNDYSTWQMEQRGGTEEYVWGQDGRRSSRFFTACLMMIILNRENDSLP